MNPFAALQVSDDEDTYTQTTVSNKDKLPKKSTLVIMQPIKKENKLKMLKSEKPNLVLLQLTKIFLKKWKRTIETKDIMRFLFLSRFLQLATILTKRVELVELTDLVKKVEEEEILEICMMNLIKTNMLLKELKSLQKKLNQL